MPWAALGWLWAPVLLGLSPIAVHASSTAIFVVVFDGRNRHLTL